MSNLFSLNLKDVLGATLSAVLAAILTYIGGLTDVFSINWQAVVSIAVITAVASILKSLTTGTEGGNALLGGAKVK